MPLWGTILTVCFSGIIALVAVITLFRGIPTRKDMESIKDDMQSLRAGMQSLRAEIRSDIKLLVDRIDSLTERFDRHLEYHAYKRESD